jgi:hypothetical protein
MTFARPEIGFIRHRNKFAFFPRLTTDGTVYVWLGWISITETNSTVPQNFENGKRSFLDSRWEVTEALPGRNRWKK